MESGKTRNKMNKKHQHSWKHIIGISGGDYNPSENVFWCILCGAIEKQIAFDDRLIKTTGIQLPEYASNIN